MVNLMNYVKDMLRVLKLDKHVYREIAEREQTILYTMMNLLVFGLIYSLSSILFSRFVNESGPVTFNPVMVMLVGVSLAFLVHSGASCFVWVFSRGIGGNPSFAASYLHLGTAWISVWFSAPAIALNQAGIRSAYLTVYLFISVVYGLTVLFIAVKEASGLSMLKMSIASFVSAVYLGCFLYLWV